MTLSSLLIVDNFYDEPDKVREYALSLNYIRKKNAPYPGLESDPDPKKNWANTISKIQQLLPSEKIQVDGYPPYPQGKFHLSLEKDRNTRMVGVHVDIARWSAVVYLSKNEVPYPGTTWYQHIPTKQFSYTKIFSEYCQNNIPEWRSSDEAKRKAIYNLSLDFNQWREIQQVAMIYNRMVLFRADFFHAANYLFGEDKASGRLTQHFILYEKNRLKTKENLI